MSHLYEYNNAQFLLFLSTQLSIIHYIVFENSCNANTDMDIWNKFHWYENYQVRHTWAFTCTIQDMVCYTFHTDQKMRYIFTDKITGQGFGFWDFCGYEVTMNTSHGTKNKSVNISNNICLSKSLQRSVMYIIFVTVSQEPQRITYHSTTQQKINTIKTSL